MLETGIQRYQVTVTHGSMLGVTAAFLGVRSAWDLDQAVISQPWLLVVLPSLAPSYAPQPGSLLCSPAWLLAMLPSLAPSYAPQPGS